MDRFSDDEALERKEDRDEKLVIDSKEKEKCEVIEILEKIKGAMKENRENWEADLRQAYEYVKGKEEESKIESKINNVKYWEDNLSTRIEHVKQTGETETWYGENIIEKGRWIMEMQNEEIKEMNAWKIFQDWAKQLEEKKAKEKSEE